MADRGGRDMSDTNVVVVGLEAFTESNWMELTRRAAAMSITFERDGTDLLVDSADEAAVLDAIVAIQDQLEQSPWPEVDSEGRIGRPAGVAARLLAGYIDMLFLAAVLIPFWIGSADRAVTLSADAVGLLSLVSMEWRYGATPGKRLLGLKATSVEMQPPAFHSALIRRAWVLPQLLPTAAFGVAISPAVAVITLATIAVSTDKRGWHDHLAGTSVVYAR